MNLCAFHLYLWFSLKYSSRNSLASCRIWIVPPITFLVLVPSVPINDPLHLLPWHSMGYEFISIINHWLSYKVNSSITHFKDSCIDQFVFETNPRWYIGHQEVSFCTFHHWWKFNRELKSSTSEVPWGTKQFMGSSSHFKEISITPCSKSKKSKNVCIFAGYVY